MVNFSASRYVFHDTHEIGTYNNFQLSEKFFPAFEKAHGDGHIACVLVDNSQGHSVYAADALRASKMNLNPGGVQPRMRDGWYLRDGERVTQPMNFPSNHSEHPNQPKGIKAVLMERGLWRTKLLLKCKGGCREDAVDCCAQHTLECQPDFQAQKSRVQEIIEEKGE